MLRRVKLLEKRGSFLLLILGCGLAFLVAEGALRLLLPGYVASAGIEQNFFCRFDDELGWRPLPDVSGQHQRHGFSVFVHQNQFGLRGPNTMRREKTTTTTRMLVLGDSYVWGYGVDQDRIFTDPQVHQSEMELINFGVSGYGTDQEFLLYLREGTFFEADEVVLAFTPYNDVENNLSPKQYDKLKPYFTISGHQLVLHRDHVRENKFQSGIDWVWSHSRVVNVLDKGFRTLQNRWFLRNMSRGINVPQSGILHPEAVSAKDREGIELTLRILLDLRDAVRSQNARFSVIFIPYKPHILKKVSHNHPFVPLLAKRLEEFHIDYYEPYFLFLHEKEAKQLFNEFDNHFSQGGHAIFGKILVNPLLRDITKDLYSRKGKKDGQRRGETL